jgi:CRP-like cAMP-binding protein
MRGRRPAERLEELGAVSLFDKLSKRELADVDSLVDDYQAPAGQVLTREGLAGREAFVILEGEAEVSIGGKAIARLGAGTFFGEMALLDSRPRSATVTAVTPMRLLLVGPASFARFVEHEGIAARMMHTVAGRLRAYQAAS